MPDVPELSVICPTRDRARDLARLVASLAEWGPSDFAWELVIVDNGSTDDTPAVCRDAERSLLQAAVTCVQEPVPGLHAGRHRGAREAHAGVLVFVDDDIEVTSSWLPALREAFADPAVEIVGGPSVPLYEAEAPDWVSGMWEHWPTGATWCGALSLLDFGSEWKEIDPEFVWGLDYAIRRDTLLRLGGFHPDALPWGLRRFRGDGETGLSRKAKATGVKAWYCPDAVVCHRVPSGRLTEDYFLKRSFLQGISDSYSAIRAFGDVPPVKPPDPPPRLRSRVKRAISALGDRGRDSAAAALRARVKVSHDEGAAYHRAEVEADPLLLEWVLRPDYMADPRLPAGD